MESALYVDSSAFLRATVEAGTSPEVERMIADSDTLLTSRLALVESARALSRLRRLRELSESRLAQAERDLRALIARCEIWDIDEKVCDLASHIAPNRNLRTLDALHLATFLLAQRSIESLKLLTTDDRLREALETA